MDFTDTSLLIIAGGQSSRMKQDKRFIEVDKVSLLENILIKASKENFYQIFLCIEDYLQEIEVLALKYNVEIIFDKYRQSGPMSGIHEGLINAQTNWTFAVSCDMPFFEFDIIKPLLKELNNDVKVVMPYGQPLAAFYNKSLSAEFAAALENGQHKLRIVIDKEPHKVIELISTTKFFNVNTPADLRLAKGRAANLKRKIPIISVIAPKSGTGKTTFIERLITRLKQFGIKVGVIKSDSHGFNLDVEGKDSYKFQKAGAQAVAVVSPNGYFVQQKTSERADFSIIAKNMDVDLIFTESRTHGTKPAISLYRSISEPMITEDVAALFTDTKFDDIDDVAQYDINDIACAVNVCRFLKGDDYEINTF